ncbi:MAG TPA: tetratricopeptide repeat protein, partial [bacterium]|nr:tetratricopeptide repeat protein [bacterium]
YGWSGLSAVRTDEWSWVRAPRPELYRMTEDPDQSENLAGYHDDVVEDLRAFLDRVEARGGDAHPVALDPEEAEALRSLGYAMTSEVPESSGQDPKDMLPLWNEIYELRDLVNAEDYEAVARRAPELLEQDPDNSYLLFYLGQAQLKTGRPEEGLAHLRRAFELNGSRMQAGTVLARTLGELGRVDEARALLESFVEAEPEYADHAYNLGVLLSSIGDDEGAIAAYEKAIAANPNSVASLANCASVRERTGRNLERALELIERARELALNDDRPTLFRARILDALGRTDEAMASLRQLAARSRLAGITREELAEAIRALQ